MKHLEGLGRLIVEPEIRMNSLIKRSIIYFTGLSVILGSLNMDAIAYAHNSETRVLVSKQLQESDTTTTKDMEGRKIKILDTDEASSDKESKLLDEEDTDNSKSIVSFNFIYYLIQKFKFSDLLGR